MRVAIRRVALVVLLAFAAWLAAFLIPSSHYISLFGTSNSHRIGLASTVKNQSDILLPTRPLVQSLFVLAAGVAVCVVALLGNKAKRD